jgi:hypothetical protein
MFLGVSNFERRDVLEMYFDFKIARETLRNQA